MARVSLVAVAAVTATLGMHAPAWAQGAGVSSQRAAARQGVPAGRADSAATLDAAAKPPVPGRASENSLVVYFQTGSTSLTSEDDAVLDQASRLFRAGHPVLMVVSGFTDTTGSPRANLDLSQARADAVLRQLVARGIPAERFQIVAAGQTELAVATDQGVPNPTNRRVVISWR